MKKIDYYLNLPYRLEIVPDPDEGGDLQRAILSFRDASHAATRWTRLYRMLLMQNVLGSRLRWKRVWI